MFKKLFLLTFFVVMLGPVGSAAAVERTWNGDVSTNWFDPNNWDPKGVPTGGYDQYTGDVVRINGGVSNFPVINTTDPCAWCRKLWLGSAVNSGEAYLTIEADGELTVHSYDTDRANQTIVLGKANGTHGILTMTGGTINMAPGPAEDTSEQMEVGGRSSTGRGTFNMTGGQFNNGHIIVADYECSGTSTVNLDGGVIDCNNFRWALLNKNGTLNLYSGSLICDFLGFYNGGYCNLYGGVINSNDWMMQGGGTAIEFGGFDIYDGVWINRSQNKNEGRTSWRVRWYHTETPPAIFCYDGRGAMIIECFPCDPNLDEHDWPGFKVSADFDTNDAYFQLYRNLTSQQYSKLAKNYIESTSTDSSKKHIGHDIVKKYAKERNWPLFKTFLKIALSYMKSVGYSRTVLPEYIFEEDYKLAKKYFDQENFGKAVEICEDMLKYRGTENDTPQLKFDICQTLFNANEYQKAMSKLDSFITEYKLTHDAMVKDARAMKGRAYIQLGEISKAIDEFLGLIIEYPKAKELPEANFFVGYCYMLQSKFDLAKETLELVVKDYPQSTYAGKARMCLARIKNMGK